MIFYTMMVQIYGINFDFGDLYFSGHNEAKAYHLFQDQTPQTYQGGIFLMLSKTKSDLKVIFDDNFTS